jgi:hypothetical protein
MKLFCPSGRTGDQEEGSSTTPACQEDKIAKDGEAFSNICRITARLVGLFQKRHIECAHP